MKVIRSITEEKEGQKKGRTGKKTNSSGLVAQSLQKSNFLMEDITAIKSFKKVKITDCQLDV